MPSDAPIDPGWPETEQQDNSFKTYALSGKIMLTSIVTLFVVVVFLVLLHIYSRWYLHRLHRGNDTGRHNRSTRVVYYVNNNRPLASPRGGLHASILKSLPLFVYSPESNAGSPECAVCLSEFETGETGRVLPNCKHKFHTGCIDMWFFSNSTCPLCRSPVEPVHPVQPEVPNLSEPGSSITSPETTSSREMRKLRVDVRIDVPSRSDSASENEFRSPGSRLLSLKRIISMNRKSPTVSPSSGVGTSSLPVANDSDHESARQGEVSSRQEPLNNSQTC